MKSLIFISAIFCLSFITQDKNEITTTRVYTSKKCTYSVYKVKSGGTFRCQDFTFVGVVSPMNNVAVSAKKGESWTIYVVHGNRKPCGDRKLSTSITVSAFQRQSSLIREELSDRNCRN